MGELKKGRLTVYPNHCPFKWFYQMPWLNLEEKRKRPVYFHVIGSGVTKCLRTLIPILGTKECFSNDLYIILWIDRAYVSRIMVTLDDTFVILGLPKVLVLMGENQSLSLWCQYLLNAYNTVGLWPRKSFLTPLQVSYTAVSEASFLLVNKWDGLYLINTLIFVFEAILPTDLAFSWLGVLDLVLNWGIQACLLLNHHTWHCIILMYM